MTEPQASAPSRRTVLAGAFGIGAIGGVGLTADAAAASVGDVTIPSTAGSYYLGLDGITGDVVTRGFEGQVALLTFGWGVTNTTDPLAGGGGGSGKSVPGELIAVAYTGIHSPPLVGTLNSGRRVSTATLSCAKKGSKPFTYLVMTFGNVVVTSYYLTPDVTTGRPLDVFHLRYTKISQTFTPQDSTGAAGTPVVTTWDYTRNAPS